MPHPRTVLAILAIMTTTSATPVQAAPLDLSRAKYGAIMADAYYDSLARCETAGNWQHSTRTYTGGLGIHRGTAHRWSGRRNLANLTPRQQVRIADRIAFSGWTNRAGEYVWPVGPFGWGAIRNGCGPMLRYLCQSRHPRVQKHRARACRLQDLHG